MVGIASMILSSPSVPYCHEGSICWNCVASFAFTDYLTEIEDNDDDDDDLALLALRLDEFFNTNKSLNGDAILIEESAYLKILLASSATN